MIFWLSVTFWLSDFLTLWTFSDFLIFWLYDLSWLFDFMTFSDFFWLSDFLTFLTFWLNEILFFCCTRQLEYKTFFLLHAAAAASSFWNSIPDFLARIAHWSGILLLFWRFELITNFLMFCSQKNTVNALAKRHFQTISECKCWWSRFWRNWCQWKCKFFLCQSYTAWTRCKESNYPGFWRRRWEIPDLCSSCRRESYNRNWIWREYRTQAVVWRSCS